MTPRRRRALYAAASAVVAIAVVLWLRLWTTGALSPRAPAAPPPAHPVDIVFVIDTTASMGPVIEAVQHTLWPIAAYVREVDPAADLHVGLVAFRDVGEAYVTKDLALTGDLDSVFGELLTYTAEGGGDVPEEVDAALHDAVHVLTWRAAAKKLIFLVGDAPPAERGNAPSFRASVSDAAKQHIVINAIQCGAAPDTTKAWQEIATPTGGALATISPTDDATAELVTTPYDDQLAELSRAIDAAAVPPADPTTRALHEARLAAIARAPSAVRADRAAYHVARQSPQITELVARRAGYLRDHPHDTSRRFDAPVKESIARALR